MKNRRARGAKFSEYRLKKLVTAFARDLTAKDTAAQTGFSEPTVRKHFMTIRQRIYDHGFMRVNKRDGTHMPARWVFAKKHRGVPEKYAHLYEAEFLHRVFATKKMQSVRRLSPTNPQDMKTVRSLVRYNKATSKYDIIEVFDEKTLKAGAAKSRPYDPSDCKTTSTIVINERNLNPHEAFFRFIWALLLKHPL